MSKTIKKHTLELKLKYHKTVVDYCFKKIAKSDPTNNQYWTEKAKYHVRKESDIFGQILKLREA